MNKDQQILTAIYENINQVETIEYPLIQSANGSYKRQPFDWRNFKVGKFYSDGDILNYVKSLHEDFYDDDRIEGVYKLTEISPDDIGESEWEIDDWKVDEYANKSTEFPPIVIDSDGNIIDGGHRLEAARIRGDEKILVFIPV